MRKQNHWSTLAFYLSVALGVWACLRVFYGFEGLYGQDAYAHLTFAKRLASGEPHGDYAWPPGYAFLGAIISKPFNLDIVLVLQLISVCSLGGIAHVTHALIRERSDSKWLAWVILSAILFSPFALRSGMVIMTDLLSAFLVSLVWWMYIQLLKNPTTVQGVVLVAASLLSILTRYPSAILIAGPLIHTFVHLLKRRQWKTLAISTLGLTPCIPLLIVLHDPAIGVFLNHGGLTHWHIRHLFVQGAAFEASPGQRYWPQILSASAIFWHPGFFFLYPIAWLKRKAIFKSIPNRIALASIIIYILFIGSIGLKGPMNMRYFIPLVPMAAFLFLPALLEVQNNWLPKRCGHLWVIVCVIQLGLSARAMNPLLNLHQEEVILASELQELPNADIYSFGMDVSLNHYLPNHQWHTLFQKTEAEIHSGSLILAQESWGTGADTTQPHPIMKTLRSHQRLETLQSLSGNWYLYKVH